MAKFEITNPQGEKFIVEAPDGATDDQVMSFAASQMNKRPPSPSLAEVAINAVPKSVANLVNLPVTAWNLAKAAASGMHPQIKEDATPTPNYPMKGMEAIGLVNPKWEPQTPGQRIVDTAVQAGTSVGLAGLTKIGKGPQLAKDLYEVGKDVVTGLVAGTAGQVTKEATGSDLLAIIVGTATPMAISGLTAKEAPTLNRVGKETLKDARAAGYVVQPSTIKPSFTTNKLESVAGKAAVAQDASVRNQAVTNKLAAKSIGLADDAPITMEAIEKVREKAGKVYEEVDRLRASQNMEWFPRFHSTSLAEDLKRARADASKFYDAFKRTGHPQFQEQADAAASLASSIEDDLIMIAQAAGQPQLLQQLQAARQLYARTYAVERALNLGDGNVSAAMIGRMLDKGTPLTGELKVIGKFAQAFPRVTRDGSAVPPPSVAGTDAFSSAMLGTVGYGAMGGPAGLVAGGLPLVRGPVRNLVLSERYQSSLLNPPPSLSSTLTKSGLVGRTLLDYRDDVTQ